MNTKRMLENLIKNYTKEYSFRSIHELYKGNILNKDDLPIIFEKIKLRDFYKFKFSDHSKYDYRNRERNETMYSLFDRLSALGYSSDLLLVNISRIYPEKEVKIFIQKNPFIVNELINFKLFKKIIRFSSQQTIAKVIENQLSEEQIVFLIKNNINIKISQNTPVSNIYNHLMHSNSINQNDLILFLKKHLKNFPKLNNNNAIILLFNHLLSSTSNFNKIIKKKSNELELLIDKLIITENIQKIEKTNIWKFKRLYNDKHKINNMLIFHDINTEQSNNPDNNDYIVKNVLQYDFRKVTKNLPIAKLIKEKTISDVFIYPYFYRAFFAIQNILPEIDEHFILKLKDLSNSHLKMIDKYRDYFNKITTLILKKENISLEKQFHFIINEIKEDSLDKISEYLFDDTIKMYEHLILKEWQPKNFKKRFKNIIELHDYLSLELKKRNQENFRLNQDIENTCGNKIGKNKYIYIPKTNHELIEIGDYLNICVGNGVYANDILNKKLYIITIKEKNKIIACVSLEQKTLKIIECNGFSNKPIRLKQEESALLFKIMKESLNNKN